MAVIYVKYIAVNGRLPATDSPQALLQRYCYDHTRVIDFQENGLRFVAVCRTESAQSEENANFLADYQAGRFRSGVMGATVHDSAAAAMEHLQQ